MNLKKLFNLEQQKTLIISKLRLQLQITDRTFIVFTFFLLSLFLPASLSLTESLFSHPHQRLSFSQSATLIGHVFIIKNPSNSINFNSHLFTVESTHFDSLSGSFHAEVAMSDLVCHPSIRHPLFSSTLYPSPPANKANKVLACLNAFEPK